MKLTKDLKSKIDAYFEDARSTILVNAIRCSCKSKTAKLAIFRWLWRVRAKKWERLLDKLPAEADVVVCDMAGEGICQYELKNGCCDVPLGWCANQQILKGRNKTE